VFGNGNKYTVSASVPMQNLTVMTMGMGDESTSNHMTANSDVASNMYEIVINPDGSATINAVQ
jgi:hypothetical protein